MGRKSVLKSSRLGVSLGANYAAGQSAWTGWTLVEERLKIENRAAGDPLALALSVSDEGDVITLIAYADDASFSKSQAARDGLTRAQHFEFLKKIEHGLKQASRHVEIKFFRVEDE